MSKGQFGKLIYKEGRVEDIFTSFLDEYSYSNIVISEKIIKKADHLFKQYRIILNLTFIKFNSMNSR